jgi:hypothetical protein
MLHIHLPQRRLLQNSVVDLMLATAVVVALIITHQSLAPRAFVYTGGFLGGLLGAAIGLSRPEPRVRDVAFAGLVVGITVAWVGALLIEALRHGMLIYTPWFTQESHRGRIPATNYTMLFGAIGGLVGSALYTALLTVKSWFGGDAKSGQASRWQRGAQQHVVQDESA